MSFKLSLTSNNEFENNKNGLSELLGESVFIIKRLFYDIINIKFGL